MVITVVAAVIAAALAAIIAILATRNRSAAVAAQLGMCQSELATTKQQLATEQSKSETLRADNARLKAEIEAERRSADEKLKLLTEASEQLRTSFEALAAQALKSNNESFLQLAKSSLEKFQSTAKSDLEQRERAISDLVAPIRQSLEKVDTQIREVEKAREKAYGTLTAQVDAMIGAQRELQAQTGNLVKALRTPNVRGRWGEIQLRRVVEIAGMLNYCDFTEQATVHTVDGRLRPDLIVRLPGGKNIVVDAKTPLVAFLEACEAQDETVRAAMLQKHAQQVRDHMQKLGAKNYCEGIQPTPEFVVMFLPGETFFSAALEQNPALIEEGVAMRVIPASPTTLIALLRAVAYGWQQETIAENAQRIASLGRELYERLAKFGEHMESVGKGLDRAVDSYNKAVGTMETRVFVSARKLADYGATANSELPEPPQVEKQTRELQASDWKEEPELLQLAASVGSDD